MTAPEEPNHVWDLEDDFEEDLPSWRDIEHPDARMSDDEEDTQIVYNSGFSAIESLETSIAQMRRTLQLVHRQHLIGPQMGVQMNNMKTHLAKLDIALGKLLAADTLGKLQQPLVDED